MVFAGFISVCYRRPLATAQKNDVAEYPEVFDHVGLLINEFPLKRVAHQLVVRRLEFDFFITAP
jgi:hypothetical protein